MMASLVVQMIQQLPAMQELQDTWVRSLGQENPWRRKWQPTAAFLPGKSHGQGSLVGYNAWGLKESDTTERTRMHSFRKCSLNGYYNFNHYIITQPAYADSLKKPQ